MKFPAGLDPRTTPARPDLAAAHLRGKVQAACFVDGTVKRVIAATAPVRHHPSPGAALDTEALHGETVTIYETTEEGWCWGQLDLDSYVGFLPAGALGDAGAAPTHRVSALRTLVFPGPDIKLPPLDALSLASRIVVAREQGDFAVADNGGFIFARHLARVDSREPDFVAVAERFVGTPYLWGGRSSLGLDCSGLVQVALQAAGLSCPRETDQQEKALGTKVDPRDLAQVRRGDLLFWKGHVAVAVDGKRMIHASGSHMQVVIEPIVAAIVRIRPAAGDVTSIKRPGAA